ncbi:MAG: hypothetical protein H6739_27705 [Alphaproteobacteria bacterium]|nr:hypothetical protein [Alphaproteobacteria bacterium]
MWLLLLLAGCGDPAGASSVTPMPSASLPSTPLEVALDGGAMALRWPLPPTATRVTLESVGPGETTWTTLRDGPAVSGLRQPAPDGLRWVRLRWSDGAAWSAWSAARVDPAGEPLGAPERPRVLWHEDCPGLRWSWDGARPDAAHATRDGVELPLTDVFAATDCDLPVDATSTLTVRPWDAALVVEPFPFDSLAQPGVALQEAPRWPIHGLYTEAAIPDARWVLDPGVARVAFTAPQGVSAAQVCLQLQEADGSWAQKGDCTRAGRDATLMLLQPGLWRLLLRPGDRSERPLGEPVLVPPALFEVLAVRMVHDWPDPGGIHAGLFFAFGAGRWAHNRAGVQVGWSAAVPVEARVERSLDGQVWALARDYDGRFRTHDRWLDTDDALDPLQPVHYRVTGRLPDGTLLQRSAPWTVPAADSPPALPLEVQVHWTDDDALAELYWTGLDPGARVQVSRCRAWTDEDEAVLLARYPGKELMGATPFRVRGQWRSPSSWGRDAIPWDGCAAPADWRSEPVAGDARRLQDPAPDRSHFALYCLESHNHRGEPADGQTCVLLPPTERTAPPQTPAMCPPTWDWRGAEIRWSVHWDRRALGAQAQRSVDGGASWQDMASAELYCHPEQCSVLDPDAPDDVHLRYRARLVSAAGATSGWAEPIALGARADPVTAPTFDAVTWDAEARMVRLSWTFSEGVSKWRIERHGGDGAWAMAEGMWNLEWWSGKWCVTDAVDRRVEPGETWTYRIAARSWDGTIVTSPEVSIAIPTDPP